MNEAAKYLIGEHDFISFCAANHQAEETVRTIYGAEVKKNDEDIVTIRLCGSGFLYNMVRILAGTLVLAASTSWTRSGSPPFWKTGTAVRRVPPSRPGPVSGLGGLSRAARVAGGQAPG